MDDVVMGISHCPSCGKQMKIRKMKARYDFDTGELEGHDLEIMCSNGFFKCSDRRGYIWTGWVGINRQSGFDRWIITKKFEQKLLKELEEV